MSGKSGGAKGEKVRRLLPESMDANGLFAQEHARILGENKKLEEEKKRLKEDLGRNAASRETGTTQHSTDVLKAQHKDEIQKINGKIDASESENGDLKKRLEGMKDQSKTSDNEREDLKRKIQSMKDDDKRKNNSSDFEGKEILLERNKDLERNLEQSNENIATKQSQLQTLEKKVGASERENWDLKKRLEGIEDQLKTSECEKDDLKRIIQSMKDDDHRKDNSSDFEGKKILLERNNDLERNLEQANETIANKQSQLQTLEKKVGASERENWDLKKRLEGIEDQLKTSECEKDDLKRIIQSMKDDDHRKDNSSDFEGKKILLERNNDLERNLEQANETIANKQSQLQTLEKEKDTLKKAIEKLNNTVEGLEKRTKNSSNSTIKDLEEENDKLKTRLSQMAGAKLMTNNPNIADLSDTNRPTKLAEQYSEMYDNEWTNTFELLQRNNLSEVEIIKTLYGILIEIFKFCFELSTNHANLLKDAVTSIAFIKEAKYERKHTDDNKIIPTKLRLLKDLRKAFAPDITDSVLECYLEKQEPKHTDKQEMMEYLKSV